MTSSINNYFTLNYSQPDEYHFSHDSIFLSRHVFELLKSEGLNYNHILDLCAGCGVVGLDLLFHINQENLKLPLALDFIEVQDIYGSHFEKNLASVEQLLTSDLLSFFKIINYRDVTKDPLFQGRYDLIVCNPPYFRLNHGSLSGSEFKNRCRFFIDSNFRSLIEAVQYCLAPMGKAFVLIKNLKKHGLDIEQELSVYATEMTFQKIGIVRTTDLFAFTKIPSK